MVEPVFLKNSNMRTYFSSKFSFLIILFISFPVFSFAATGKPFVQVKVISLHNIMDTIPSAAVKKTTENKVEKKVEPPVNNPVKTVIKSVPKVRKQAIPVPVKVTPVIKVKPKVIKPIIRVIN